MTLHYEKIVKNGYFKYPKEVGCFPKSLQAQRHQLVLTSIAALGFSASGFP